ncbi:hypothetical protein OEZ86_006205 [Tetradesmus obliquus]|nr:hypothetical protein OEZ86_006205 [Tetradesmus obliquus]
MIDAASRQRTVAGAQLAWSQLTQLTALSCCQCDLSDAAVAGLTVSLTKLQRLDLSGNQIRQPAALLPPPPGLTLLTISNNHQHLDISQLLAAAAALQASESSAVEAADAAAIHAGSSTEGMDVCDKQQQQQQQQLGGLQHLEVSGLALSEPHLLTGLQALTHLVAKDLKVDNPPLLLEALAPLSALRHLELRGTFRKRPGSVADPASLSLALTDKQHLSFLDLGQNRIHELGAAAQPGGSFGTALMTPPWQLPELQVLLLDCLPLSRGTADDFPQYRMQAHDLQQLPRSCPSLQQLDLRGRIHGEVSGRELQPLLQLAGTLTSLSLGGGEFDRGLTCSWVVRDDALSVVCQLTRLESLTVVNASDVSDVGLLSLCKLKQLRELRVLQLPADEEAVSEVLAPRTRAGEREIKLSTKRHKAPNVWQQLLTRCNRSPACLRARQKELEQELAAAHKVAAKERRRAAAAERDAAAAQGEVAALRQQLAELQAANSQGSQ